MAIDKLAQMLEMDFNQEKFSAYFSKKKIDGEDIILLKPTTYMNNSGIALRQCMDFYKVSAEDILVLYDDMDMPVGKLRLRQKGSAGGHNGIKSIISHIGTQEFDRIRIGIGKDKMIPVVDCVLDMLILLPLKNTMDIKTIVVADTFPEDLPHAL